MSSWKWYRGIKMVPSFPLLSCALLESVEEKGDEKRKKGTKKQNI